MTFENAYEAGFDAGNTAPNDSNCHFGWFSSPERQREWERGNADGKRLKASFPAKPDQQKEGSK